MPIWLQSFRVFAVLVLTCQGTLVLAGTTGALSGVLTDAATHVPLAGAKVTVTSPSQNGSVLTDASGHFAFLSLAPDTYTVTETLTGYDTSSISGTTVIADQTRTLSVTASKTLQTIGKVTTRAASDLVKPGTTADVYSVNSTQQDKLSVLGGGGNLNSAFSALASVPGVFVSPGTGGYNTVGAVSIRGGDYNQIGYELDGVPINRAFDTYPSGTVSSLGQQELQVYTGAAPANAEAQGLSGFINQVIKTGTYPAETTVTGDLGGQAFYHKFAIETGGATEDRNFSYYVGLGGYNQDFRYNDQFNGQGIGQLYGQPLAPCTVGTPASSCYNGTSYNGFTGGNPNFGSGSYVLGTGGLFNQSNIADRNSVVNLHFGLPHKNGTKDDIQVLLDVDHLASQYYSSTSDQGGVAYLKAIGFGAPFYTDGYQYSGRTGGLLPKGYTGGGVVPYLFPNSGSRPFSDIATGDVVNIPVNLRDGMSNNQNIFKLQYTHAIGTNALLRVYAYTDYSDWLQQGPQTAYSDYIGSSGPDYELNAHTRGVSAQFTAQLGANNVLALQSAYTTSTTLRDNNTQMFNGLYAADNVNLRTVFGALVNANSPYSGLCYARTGAAVGCFSGPSTLNPAADYVTLLQAHNNAVPAATGTCGGGPCQYLVVENGQYATYNTVTPQFTSVSLTDQYKPTAKLTIDGGIRLDRYAYVGSNTTGTQARSFWYAAYNLDNCVTTKAPITIITRAPGAACPAGSTPANFTNPTGNVTEGYDEFQPRIGATYSLNPTTVLRANFGRFTQAPNSAYQQYDALQQDAPALLYGTYGFQTFGFTTPNHTVVPPTSDNLDLSVEHQFGTDAAIKLTPFLRTTQNQIQNFYLNQETGFVSGLNVGHQTSEGVEFELDKGNFSRNGFAGKLSLAYTNSYIKYQPLSNGSSVIAPLNQQIKTYNAYTSFCAAHPTTAQCAGATTESGAVGAPCYTAGGVAVVLTGCTAADIANPYWNAPVQGLLDPNANYSSFNTITSGIGSSVVSYGAPYTATLLLQYKHNRIAITPALQFLGGQRYGAPASTLGIAPDTCTAALGSTAGDPRYVYGSTGGSSFNYADCATLVGGVPDPYTGKFDNIGQFVAPMNFLLHLQLTYDITPRVSLVVNLANLINDCFGGSKTGFTVAGACGYTYVGNGTSGDIGNRYNPGQAIQPYVNTPYEPTFSSAPFGVFISARVKI